MESKQSQNLLTDSEIKMKENKAINTRKILSHSFQAQSNSKQLQKFNSNNRKQPNLLTSNNNQINQKDRKDISPKIRNTHIPQKKKGNPSMKSQSQLQQVTSNQPNLLRADQIIQKKIISLNQINPIPSKQTLFLPKQHSLSNIEHQQLEEKPVQNQSQSNSINQIAENQSQNQSNEVYRNKKLISIKENKHLKEYQFNDQDQSNKIIQPTLNQQSDSSLVEQTHNQLNQLDKNQLYQDTQLDPKIQNSQLKGDDIPFQSPNLSTINIEPILPLQSQNTPTIIPLTSQSQIKDEPQENQNSPSLNLKQKISQFKQQVNSENTQSKPLISIIPKNGQYNPAFLKQQQAFEALCIPKQKEKEMQYPQLILVDQQGKESIMDTKIFSNKLVIPYKQIEEDFNKCINDIYLMIIQIGHLTFLYPGTNQQEMDNRMTEQLIQASRLKISMQKKFINFPILTLETAHKCFDEYKLKHQAIIPPQIYKIKYKEARIRENTLKLYLEAEHKEYSNLPTNVSILRNEMTSFHIMTMYREYLHGKLLEQSKPIPIKTKDRQSKIILQNLTKVLENYMNLVVDKFLKHDQFKDQEIRLIIISRFREIYSIINYNIIQKYNDQEIITDEVIGKEIQPYLEMLQLIDSIDFLLEYTKDKIPLEIIEQWLVL